MRLYLLSPFFLVSLLLAEPISSDSVYKVKNSKKKMIACAVYRNKPVSVYKRKSSYLVGSDVQKDLSKKIKKAKGRKKQQLKEKLAKTKQTIKDNDKVCKKAPVPPTPTPPAYVPPTDFLPLDRAMTREDVEYFMDKAGLGLSAEEESLVTIATTLGVDAFVNEFMRTKDEPSGLLDRITDRLDGQMGSVHTQTPVGQDQALLDLWIHTNNPYAERFALFLLSVWTTAGDVIADETFRGAFWDYYGKLRAAAYGETNLPDLGVSLARDPLMLIYLNNELNVKNSPNENFARELMELFSLGPTNLDGEPNYTETALDGSGDIAVAARMLTGWKVTLNYISNTLDVSYVANRHANGPHTMFLGKSYQFSGENDEDLIRGIFAHHPNAKIYYAQEILKEYLTPHPSRALVEAFGDVIAGVNYKLRPAMAILFKSGAFYNPYFKDSVPTNCLEFAAKTVRLLGMRDAVNVNYAEEQLRKMGMQFNLAPSVFWFNQSNWVSPGALLEKANYVAELFNNKTAWAQPDPDWAAQTVLPVGAATPSELIEFVRKRLRLPAYSTAENENFLTYLSQERIYNGTYQPFTYNNTSVSHQELKGLPLYYIMMTTPEFQLK